MPWMRTPASVPSAAEVWHRFPDVWATALGCAFSPPVFAPASQVYFCACLFKQENAVIFKVIIKKWSLWSKGFDLTRDVYKMMKCWLTEATKFTDLPLSRAAVTSSPWAYCTHYLFLCHPKSCLTPHSLETLHCQELITC